MKEYKGKLGTIFLVLILFALNIFLIWPLFFGQYTQSLGSIESAFLTDIIFITKNFPHLSWSPLWYLGFPFHFAYPPLIPYFLAFISSLFNLSIPSLYRFFIAFFYALGPISLYFFVRYLTKNNLVAFISAFLYSILPSFVYLIPEVRAFGANFYYAPWRLVVLNFFGEGPHISTLTIIPLVLIAFLFALRKPSVFSFILASISVAIIPLANIPSTISLLIMIFALIFSESLIEKTAFKIKRAFLILLVSFGLISFWYTLPYIKITFLTSSSRENWSPLSYLNFLPLVLFIFSLFLVIFVSIFSKKRERQPLCFALISVLSFSFIVLTWYLFKKPILPEPNRFMPEIEMNVAILLGLLLTFLYQKIKFLGPILLIFIFGLSFWLSLPFLKNSQEMTRPYPDISQTSEYQIANWLSENTKEKRVYATGSTGFWLNVFSDVPQVRGGADQGATNPWWNHAAYQINTSENAKAGEDGPIALLWLRAFNVSYIVVNLPHSRDAFKDYRNPYKFQDLLEPVYDKRGDIIYKVPLKSESLAQVVDEKKLKELKKPYNAIDKVALAEYVDWVDEKAKNADFAWLSNQEFKVKANTSKDEIISVQITYDPGWKIKKGKGKIEKDTLGLLLIKPAQEGEMEFHLKHGKTFFDFLGILITLATVGVLSYSVSKKRESCKDKESKKEEENLDE